MCPFQTIVVCFSLVNIKSTKYECCVALSAVITKKHNIMVGQIIGAAAQVGSAIYGAVKSSEANKKAQQMIQNQRDENRKWYDQKMAEDYMQRSDVQNVLRKQRELLNEQYQRARATNIVAGGTDEALALQQQAANDAMGDTMADIAANATDYKENVEQQYRTQDAALNQQQIGVEQAKAQSIAQAASQMGSAVSGLMTGVDATKSGKVPLTTKQVNLYADAQQQIANTLEEDLAKADAEIDKIFA